MRSCLTEKTGATQNESKDVDGLDVFDGEIDQGADLSRQRSALKVNGAQKTAFTRVVGKYRHKSASIDGLPKCEPGSVGDPGAAAGQVNRRAGRIDLNVDRRGIRALSRIWCS